MHDFTSALYLGLHHPSASLRPWGQLTTGKPAAFEAPVSEQRLARWLAGLVGCEQAVFGPSTLHLFWDLFGVLAKQEVSVYLDAGAYPIAHWGASAPPFTACPCTCLPITMQRLSPGVYGVRERIALNLSSWPTGSVLVVAALRPSPATSIASA